jgi:hypothetical protein
MTENPTRASRRRLRVSGDSATRRYFGGWIQLRLGVYNRAVIEVALAGHRVVLEAPDSPRGDIQ